MDDISSLSDDELRKLVGENQKKEFRHFTVRYIGSVEKFWSQFEDLRHEEIFRGGGNFRRAGELADYFLFGSVEKPCFGKIENRINHTGLCDVVFTIDKDGWNAAIETLQILKAGLPLLDANLDILTSVEKGENKDDSPLTEKQVEVLQLISDKKTPKEIAKSLCIAISTVNNHIADAIERIRDYLNDTYRKEIPGRHEAAAYAKKQGWIR